MCLIAIAVRASERWPLVIAANRDESYARPTRALHLWDDDANVAGGRDLLAGGSWLAVARDGRFAAVTNLRGIEAANPRSRGELVSDFVRSNAAPLAYAESVRTGEWEYAGFHLIVGDRKTVAHVASDAPARLLDDGIFAVSNAPAAVDWPKIVIAREAMKQALEGDLVDDLMRFLTTPRGGPTEQEVFVSLPEPGYGTRSSTVVFIVNEEIMMREMSHPSGEVVTLRIITSHSSAVAHSRSPSPS